MIFEYGHTKKNGTEEKERIFGEIGEEKYDEKALKIGLANYFNATSTKKGKVVSKTSFYWIREKVTQQ